MSSPGVGRIQGPYAEPRRGQGESHGEVAAGDAAVLVTGPPQPRPPPADPHQPGQPKYRHGHGPDQVRRHVAEIGQDRAEAEGDLTWPVPGAERTAVDQIVEGGRARAEQHDRTEPPPKTSP